MPDVSISEEKYVIKLFIPSAEGMTELWLRCDTVSKIMTHGTELAHAGQWPSTVMVNQFSIIQLLCSKE